MYSISIENFSSVYPNELDNLLRLGYKLMYDREIALGLSPKEYNLNEDMYYTADQAGWLKVYMLRYNDIAVGFCTLFLSQDSHTSELIADEDLVYVEEEHRNGLGKELLAFILADLRSMGISYVFSHIPVCKSGSALSEKLGFSKVSITMKRYLGE